MRMLNLDGMFLPLCCPEIKHTLSTFSGGEANIRLWADTVTDRKFGEVIVTHRVNNGNNLMEVLVAINALRTLGVEHISLCMPYVPYARQDRVCNLGESFSLKVFCNIINSFNLDKVYILDPHSDVTLALLNNSEDIGNTPYVYETLKHINLLRNQIPIIVSPDSGANKKINKLVDIINEPIGNPINITSIVKCDKKRDLSTGHISSFEVFSNDLEGRDCLIVDDICDGGRTFIGIAEALKEKGAGNLYLFVSHGIFSKGYFELSKYFTQIYTTNSISDIEDTFIKQFKIQI